MPSRVRPSPAERCPSPPGSRSAEGLRFQRVGAAIQKKCRAAGHARFEDGRRLAHSVLPMHAGRDALYLRESLVGRWQVAHDTLRRPRACVVEQPAPERTRAGVGGPGSDSNVESIPRGGSGRGTSGFAISILGLTPRTPRGPRAEEAQREQHDDVRPSAAEGSRGIAPPPSLRQRRRCTNRPALIESAALNDQSEPVWPGCL